jgi:hypothetical protein
MLQSRVGSIVCAKLDAIELARVALTCKDLASTASFSYLWQALLNRDMGISEEDDPMFVYGQYISRHTCENCSNQMWRKKIEAPIAVPDSHKAMCEICQKRLSNPDDLYWSDETDAWCSKPGLIFPCKSGFAHTACLPQTPHKHLRRCRCLCRRRKLRLIIADFCRARVQESIPSWVHFKGLRDILNFHFEVEYQELDEMTEQALANVDLLFCNTTMMRTRISESEKGALQGFKGTMVLNSFSLYGGVQDFGNLDAIMAPLRIQPAYQDGFGDSIVHNVIKVSEKPMTNDDGYDDLLDGPYGAVRHIANQGETRFSAPHKSMVPICQRSKIGSGPHAEADLTFAWFPGAVAEHVSAERDDMDEGGAPLHLQEMELEACGWPLARTLICSNWHWFTDEQGWNGGLINKSDNNSLLLNLAAVASMRDV